MSDPNAELIELIYQRWREVRQSWLDEPGPDAATWTPEDIIAEVRETLPKPTHRDWRVA